MDRLRRTEILIVNPVRAIIKYALNMLKRAYLNVRIFYKILIIVKDDA